MLLIVAALYSCGDKKDSPERIDSGFTAGVVSNQARIRIRLTEPVPSAIAGEEVKESMFIERKTVWIDNKVIEFQLKENAFWNDLRCRV